MSTESTEAVFAALALANIPAHSWNARNFTDHQQEAGPLAVTGYSHSITAQGVVSLAFTVEQDAAMKKVTGKFKKEASTKWMWPERPSSLQHFKGRWTRARGHSARTASKRRYGCVMKTQVISKSTGSRPTSISPGPCLFFRLIT